MVYSPRTKKTGFRFATDRVAGTLLPGRAVSEEGNKDHQRDNDNGDNQCLLMFPAHGSGLLRLWTVLL
jgi:hypothetical protein